MVKTIIFDYDGTIHNTLRIYEPAFRKAYQWLVEQNVVEEQKIESSRIAGWLGLNSKEIWYPGAEKMLTTLKNRGYHSRLIITPSKVIVTTPGADNKKEI
ncbi:hypothetical protein [Dorea sp.]